MTAEPSSTATQSPAIQSPTRPLSTATLAPTLTPAPTATPQSWPVFRNLIISPSGPKTLYAAIGDHAYRSDDAGLSWARLDGGAMGTDTRVLSVAMDYRNPNVLYTTTSTGIYRSVDGAPWAFVHPLVANALAIDLVESDVLWAGVTWTTEYKAVILKSSDGGRTWGKADYGISGYGVSQIIIDPVDPNILYANLRYGGRFGWPEGWLARGGRNGTWERLDLWDAPPGQFSDTACMANGLAFDPGLRRLYVGCDAYYYNNNRVFFLMSDNAHDADSRRVQWRDAASSGVLHRPDIIGFVRPLAVDARDPKALYVLTSGVSPSAGQPYQIIVSHDDAKTWSELPLNAIEQIDNR